MDTYRGLSKFRRFDQTCLIIPGLSADGITRLIAFIVPVRCWSGRNPYTSCLHIS
ncbi:hypothetical protein [Rhodoblastus sp.]|uniref:hypothetical protein n=1 Tax=Rhodoblastus sp. TaxID=1962975 RepID=UPI003F9C62FA